MVTRTTDNRDNSKNNNRQRECTENESIMGIRKKIGVDISYSTFRYKNNTSFFRLISRYFKSSQLDFLKYSKYYLLDILGFVPRNFGSG